MHPSELTPARVAGFLLLNPAFPRSVYLCVREAADALAELKHHYRLRAGNDISEGLDGLRAILEERSIEEILAGGLHEFLDFLQGYLIAITDRVSAAFFAADPFPAAQAQPPPLGLLRRCRKFPLNSVGVVPRQRPRARLMQLLTVRHVTTYRYRQPVAFGEHRMMLRPRDSYDQRLIEAQLDITPEPVELRWVHDVFGNCVAIARFSGRAQELRFDSTIRLDHSPTNALEFEIEDYARRYPFTYGADEMPDLLRSIERQYLDPEPRRRPLGAAVPAP